MRKQRVSRPSTFETLETRELLSQGIGALAVHAASSGARFSQSSVSTQHPSGTIAATSTNPPGGRVQNGLLAKAGPELTQVYHDHKTFVQGGSRGTFTTSTANLLVIQGTSVGVDVHGKGTGRFGAYVATLKGLGMAITSTDPGSRTVEGLLPIARLLPAAQSSRTLNISPISKVTTPPIGVIKNDPLANAVPPLPQVYQAYLDSGQDASKVVSQFDTIAFSGGLVGIDAQWNGSGSFDSYITELRMLGMQVNTSSASQGIVEGFLPIGQLVSAAQWSQTLSISPIFKPALGPKIV